MRNIEDDSYTNVVRRVTYRLIEIDYRRDPNNYRYPPGAILALTEPIRSQFPAIYFMSLAAVKWLMNDLGTLKQWLAHDYGPGLRALHKRRVPRPRR